jgi:hypothetical protein
MIVEEVPMYKNQQFTIIIIYNHYNLHTKLCKTTKPFCLMIVEEAPIYNNQQFTIIIINILSFVKVQNFFV